MLRTNRLCQVVEAAVQVCPFLEQLPKAGQAQDCWWLKTDNLQKTGTGSWTAFSRAEANRS